MSLLVVDVGTSSVRASLVHPDGTVGTVARRRTPAEVPFPGLVEFDPMVLASAARDAASEVLASSGPVDAIGVTTQRASAVAWNGATGQPVTPGLGWQDLRTVGNCLELQARGLRFSPSESATKFAWQIQQATGVAELRLGTVDSWVAWVLSGGSLHVTDATNAAVTGLYRPTDGDWDSELLAALGIDRGLLPRIVDSSGHLGEASALPGSPPICSLVGDQQASLVGQGCTRTGLAKATFGTGAMLDVCLGDSRPAAGARTESGCFPIVAWRRDGHVTWGSEAIMLAAGTAVDWLVEDMELISSSSDSEAVAAGCDDSGGVIFVPALLGLGTPQWDFGARGALFGLTRGTTRAQIVRAVLEGVAHSGADLLEATEADTGLRVESLRLDGGMSVNQLFVQALADACARPVEVSKEVEATTLGAGYLAGLATGMWNSTDEIADLWSPARVVEPSCELDRVAWKRAVERASAWHPDLSAISF